MPHADPVTPELRRQVLDRDGWRCLAPLLDPAVTMDDCRDQWSDPATTRDRWMPEAQYRRDALTLDHVKTHPMMGKRAPSDLAHLVTLCWYHHLEGWATAHRAELREYLRRVSAKVPGE